MGFTIAARTVLELGKELISSDEIAIYELIKNSVDANSKKVSLTANVVLKHSDYMEAIRRLNEEQETEENVRQYVNQKLLETANDSETQFRDSLENISTGNFLNGLKRIYEDMNYIEIGDTGHGMNLKELSTIFLRIGTDSRRRENMAGARHLGDKGIGRLSAMRLGDRLSVCTARSSDRYWNLLEIDWSQFTHDDDIDISDIRFEPQVGDEKSNPKDHGTTIRISSLQADWDVVRFTDILQGRIARMVDPFTPGLANKLIAARHNGTRVQVPSIPRALLRAAHAVCSVEFRVLNGVPTLTGEIDYRYRQRARKISAHGAEVYSLAQEPIKRRAKRGHAAYRLVRLPKSAFEKLGDFKCEIYWFNRRVVDAVEGLTTRAQETRNQISNWSGGPMLYRHGFRILPYGEPKDDWLALDEAAFGMRGFKLNRQQVIGRVSIDTPHQHLREMTNREGLIEADASNALKRMLMWVAHTEMRGLINEADDIERIERRLADQDTNNIASAQRRIEAALQRLREHVGHISEEELDDLGKRVRRLASESQKLVERIEAVIEEADQEREKFVYLAGIGLMTEFIFHELERAVSYTMDLISSGGVRETGISSLRDQLKTLHKRIAAFDELTGEKRQRRSRFNLSELLENVLANHDREFARHGIQLELSIPEDDVIVNAVRGMMIQIFENLIVNSSYWLKQQKQFESQFEPVLSVALDGRSRTLEVADNGPGILEERRERIFQPFVTTKPTGQGRGLGLYIARDLAEYHGWKLYLGGEVGAVREERLNTFVLEMGQ